MIHKIIKKEIQVPGTLEDTYMETFLLSVTDKFTVQERPLILVCPGGGYNHTSDRGAITRQSCAIPVSRRCSRRHFWN